MTRDQAASILADSPETIQGRLREFAEAGAEEVIPSLRPPYDHALLAPVVQEIIPAFRAR